MRRPLVAGNWKMNGSRSFARELVDGIQHGLSGLDTIDVLVCPSFVFLPEVASMVGSAVAVGAQNLSEHDEGAYTGEVSGAMLRDVGCQYVIVGHSERRQYCGETNESVAAKFVAAQRNGLQPILCVGETLEQREADQTNAVIAAQVQAVIDVAGIEAFSKAVIAYEPVWAIGTGRTASPEQAQDVHAFIRARLVAADASVAAGTRILYGGSMKASNADGLLTQPDIDGGLIGGASLKSDEFLAICRSAATVAAA